MKKYNIEEQLASKLGNRSITPSEQAWERISFGRQQQTQQTAKKKKKQWYSVAAAILLFFLGGYFALYTKSQNTEGIAPAVVEGTVLQPKTNLETKAQDAVVVRETQEQANELLNTTDKTIQYKINSPASADATITNEKLQAIALNNNGIQNHREIAVASNTITNAVTQSQEDILLEKALREVALAKTSSAKTNDTVLLKEVEAEMDAYYREKALRFFSLKYKKIRIVVTDNH